MDDIDELQPEETDRRYQGLIQDLKHILATNEDTAKSLHYARQQLFQRTDDRLSSSHLRLLKHETRELVPDTGKHAAIRHPQRASYPRLSAIAAVILVGLLIGSFVVLLRHTHTGSTGGSKTSVPTHTPTGIHELHMITATTGWAIGDSVTLLRTTDGGINWQDVSPPHDTKTKYWSDAVAFLGTSTVWLAPTLNTASPQFQAAATSYVFHTSDSGKTWLKAPVATHGNTVKLITFSDAQNGWLLTRFEAGIHQVTGQEQLNPPNLFRTRDGGKTWVNVLDAAKAQAQIFHNVDISGMTFIDTNTGWISGNLDGKNAKLFITQNGGVTWQQQQLPQLSQVNDLSETIEAPQFFTATDGVISVEYTYGPPQFASMLGVTVYTTHDGGKNWRSNGGFASPIPQNPHDSTNVIFAFGPVTFIDLMHGWIKLNDGVKNVLLMTDDGGHTWSSFKPFYDPAPDLFNVPDFVTPDIGYIFTFDQKGVTQVSSLYKTTDGGHTWTQLHAKFPGYIVPKSAY